MTLTFEPLTLELVRNVSRDTENLSANFGVSATFLCRVVGKHASKWRRDVINLTFDLRGHRAWVIQVIALYPYTKLVVRSLPVPKIWLFFGHGVNQYGNLDLSTSKLGRGSPVSWASSCQFSPFHFRLRVRHGTRTDRLTERDDGHQCIMSPPYEGGWA